MQKTRRRNPSLVLTSMLASIRDCHFLTIERSLSVVRSIPWKLVKTLRPYIKQRISQFNSSVTLVGIITNLDIFRDETEFSERTLCVRFALKICKGNFEHTSLQAFRGDTCINIQMKDQTQHWHMDCVQFNNLRVPCVLFTSVLPTWRLANIDGAFTSYQSLRVKGSMLNNELTIIEISYHNWKHHSSAQGTCQRRESYPSKSLTSANRLKLFHR